MDRRSLLSMFGGLSAVATVRAAKTSVADTIAPTDMASAYGIRSLGNSSAPVKIHEYFSMNCPHCAFFGTKVMPDVISNFITTGKIFYVFKDFPLNEDAVMAAQVARSLPAREYLPFITELFRTQDQWAFDPNLKTQQDYANALFRYAALAGLDKKSFDAALADQKLRAFILDELNTGEKQYNINATPSFIINGRKREGAVDFKQFSRWIAAA